jgi:4-amino-4-deoxychorismate lyase
MTLPAHWVNGEAGGTVSPGDRGFAYGDGVFETFRCHHGSIHLWELHRRRLSMGMRALGIDCEAGRIDAQLQAGLDFLVERGIDEAAGRLSVTRGVSERGYSAPAGTATLVLTLTEVARWRVAPEPQRAMLCATRLSQQPSLAGIKHCNRLEQVLAARELHQANATVGLQMNARDELVCAVSANLFLVEGDELLTPPIDTCGVAGTVRQFIIDRLAPAAGIGVRIAPIRVSRLANCRELILTNSLAGIVNVSRCEGRVFTSTHWGDTLRNSFYAWSDSTEWQKNFCS